MQFRCGVPAKKSLRKNRESGLVSMLPSATVVQSKARRLQEKPRVFSTDRGTFGISEPCSGKICRTLQRSVCTDRTRQTGRSCRSGFNDRSVNSPGTAVPRKRLPQTAHGSCGCSRLSRSAGQPGTKTAELLIQSCSALHRSTYASEKTLENPAKTTIRHGIEFGDTADGRLF